MKVYIITTTYNEGGHCDTFSILKVFTTRERAEKYLENNYPKKDGCYYYSFSKDSYSTFEIVEMEAVE